MSKKYFNVPIGFVISCMLFCSFSPVDINDEEAVFTDIQGGWTGYDHSGDVYSHIKLYLTDNGFEGWLQITDSPEEPEWTVLPNEIGTVSLSSVLQNSIEEGKFRKFKFQIRDGCCGDNSVTAWTLSRLISYQDGAGLYVAGSPMVQIK